MNGSYLYEAMGGIGQDLIAEGQYVSLGKSTARKLLELVACVAVCLGLGLAAVWVLPRTGTVPGFSQMVEATIQQAGTRWLLPYIAAAALALVSWILPLLGRGTGEKQPYVWSVLCCVLSLLLQLAGLMTLIQHQEWNIIINYVNLFLVAAAITLGLTAIICGGVWLARSKKWSWTDSLNALYLLLCLLSAIQYAFLAGVHKSWVVLGGWVELIVVAAALGLFVYRLLSGKAKRALYWANMLLLFMQIIPFLISLGISWRFCTWYHCICMLLGIRLWRIHHRED